MYSLNEVHLGYVFLVSARVWPVVILVIILGFHLGGCGDLSIRFRPALIFQLSHANMFLDGFEKVLSEKAS